MSDDIKEALAILSETLEWLPQQTEAQFLQPLLDAEPRERHPSHRPGWLARGVLLDRHAQLVRQAEVMTDASRADAERYIFPPKSR